MKDSKDSHKDFGVCGDLDEERSFDDGPGSGSEDDVETEEGVCASYGVTLREP